MGDRSGCEGTLGAAMDSRAGEGGVGRACGCVADACVCGGVYVSRVSRVLTRWVVFFFSRA